MQSNTPQSAAPQTNTEVLARCQWSRWFRCESSFGLLLVPAQPGIFALADQVLAPDDSDATGHRRMLAVFDFAAADDLAAALSRLFAPGSPVRDRLAAGECYLRYTVVSDPAQRQAVCLALRSWLNKAAGAASGFLRSEPETAASETTVPTGPSPFPSGF
jgi:hypothetical protein